MEQRAKSVLMVEPAAFGLHSETTEDNRFQQQIDPGRAGEIQTLALTEFKGLKLLLEENGVNVKCYSDYPQLGTPDSIFPNNWFSTHPGGLCVLYPLKYKTRRTERRIDIINDLRHVYGRLLNLSSYEEQEKFLEATGSLVLDRTNRIAYASLSQRTSSDLVNEWAQKFDFHAQTFQSVDRSGGEIYHTNCMMGIGQGFAVICLESITDPARREIVRNSLEQSGHRVIALNMGQLEAFCANVLELSGRDGSLIVMSKRAFDAFEPKQREILSSFGKIIYSDLQTIETFGGGSARCMLAELF